MCAVTCGVRYVLKFSFVVLSPPVVQELMHLNFYIIVQIWELDNLIAYLFPARKLQLITFVVFCMSALK